MNITIILEHGMLRIHPRNDFIQALTILVVP